MLQQLAARLREQNGAGGTAHIIGGREFERIIADENCRVSFWQSPFFLSSLPFFFPLSGDKTGKDFYLFSFVLFSYFLQLFSLLIDIFFVFCFLFFFLLPCGVTKSALKTAIYYFCFFGNGDRKGILGPILGVCHWGILLTCNLFFLC